MLSALNRRQVSRCPEQNQQQQQQQQQQQHSSSHSPAFMKINLIVLCDKRLYLNVGSLCLARPDCWTGDGKALVRRPLSSSVTLMSSVFLSRGHFFSVTKLLLMRQRKCKTMGEPVTREETCKHVLGSSLSQEVRTRNVCVCVCPD